MVGRDGVGVLRKKLSTGLLARARVQFMQSPLTKANSEIAGDPMALLIPCNFSHEAAVGAFDVAFFERGVLHVRR